MTDRIFIYISNYIKRLSSRAELVFIIIGLFFGLFFIFRLAPLSGTDEFTHFPRLYQISQGTLWEQKLSSNQFGGLLPVNINNMTNDYRNLSRYPTGASYSTEETKLNNQYSKLSNPGHKKVNADFTSSLIYPPWAFLPNLIGLVIAKAIHLPLIWYVYLTRISGLIIWLALVYWAIKLLPAGKWFLVVLALLPTALSQAATIGGDGILMGLAWLLIAMVLAAITGRLKVNWITMFLILVVSASSSLIKDGYFLIGLLPLAIPLARFISRRIAITFKAVNILIILVIALLFTLRTEHAVNGIALTPTIGMYFNSHQQISYMIHHFLSYGWHIIEQPFTKSFDTTYLGIVGILTNRLIYLSILVIGLLYACLAITFITVEPLKASIRKISKYTLPIFLSIFLFTYLLLASAFYIGNTTVGAAFVNGFYGRYFLPIIPLLLIIPMFVSHKKRYQLYVPIVLAGSLLGLISMIFSLQ